VIHSVTFRAADFRDSRFFVVRGAILHQGNKVVLSFLVDTGSVFTVIPINRFQQLRVSPAYQTQLTGIVPSPNRHDVGVVERIAIGSASVSEVAVVGVNLPAELKVDALLGSNFLQHFTLTADYRQARLLLED
jgi:predicted aspartyl protease